MGTFRSHGDLVEDRGGSLTFLASGELVCGELIVVGHSR